MGCMQRNLTFKNCGRKPIYPDPPTVQWDKWAFPLKKKENALTYVYELFDQCSFNQGCRSEF